MANLIRGAFLLVFYCSVPIYFVHGLCDLFHERSEMVYAGVSDYTANSGKFNEKQVLTLSTA